jgi:AraC-like DNA-binding protein
VREEKILKGNFEDKKIFEEVSAFLIQEKAYLRYGLKLSDLSEKTGYSLHDISRAVNKHGKVHFSDYVNGLRIKYAEDILLSLDFPTRYTIETVALESGFKNRSSFYNAFKKIHNCTPGDFRRKNHSGEKKVVSFAGN